MAPLTPYSAKPEKYELLTSVNTKLLIAVSEIPELAPMPASKLSSQKILTKVGFVITPPTEAIAEPCAFTV